MRLDFTGRIAVVTGGGKGIGRVIARRFAASGADVAVIGRDAGALADAVTEIATMGRRCLPVVADLTAAADVATLPERIEGALGPVDIVVTAAGMRDHTDLPFAETSAETFETIVRSNLLSTTLPVRALLPAMIGRGRGRVVALSGVFGLKGRARHSAGASAKWAIEGFVRSLALEVGPSGITVNAVCPGYVTGPRSAEAMAIAGMRGGLDADQVRAELEGATALKRLSTPDDVADAVLFLASDRARNITGQDLVVDAGWTL